MSMLSIASKRQKLSSLPRGPLPIIPQDLIFSHILIKLSVKPLLRFQSVSKTWLATISSPDFVKSHLNIHKNDNENWDKLVTFSATHDRLHLSLYSILAHENQFNTSDPDCSSLQIPEEPLRYLGSHNGLLCFRGNDEKVIVCNPCTGKIKKIDDAPNYQSVGIYGFGYDHQNCDYKVVYACPTETIDNYDLLIYSFRSGAWENIPQGFTADLVYPNVGVHVNGTLNWCTNEVRFLDDGKPEIVSLNLTTNFTTVLSSPKCERGNSVYISESRGFLLLSCFHKATVSVWQMKEFGVENSWTQLACISHLLPKPPRQTATITPIVVIISNAVSLLYVLNNTNVVMKVGQRLRAYRSGEAKRSGKVEVPRPGNRGFEAIIFRETLAPPPCLSDD